MEPGCYVDGARGIHSGKEVQKLAIQAGWPKGQAVMNPYSKHYYDATIAAEGWLNDHAAPPGHTFMWVDGDFMLVPVDADSMFWN